ncbi:hypothetical protein Mfla_2689 [Nostoc commune NIES-4072]|uniref:Tape measure protein N-terminal domain-containing protein n=1 Tax=Nostoc commune NIES-4072 TaxID=2005467 RepID=A0A2R5FUW3_NOSCO|nr:tape measure protein [Nostoc commune]BBD69525.1 hypothetical protein Mfla_2689 [Nostoc commune HK-02]GBG19474.1 hypothetical protein Mfla_2689 [Nostoc commune NIES-4072]
MGTLGSASIKLNLDRSQFDSDLKKLQATDAGQIAYRIKLDTKDFEQQIKGLRIQQPILIPLEIDTKTFDQQIKKLSTSIDPIKVDLAPNVKDFQEKLRRLSKITPVTVDIKVDEAKVKQQFETIGKYAAEGFTQGFSGVEGAGKSAIDSMVKSVNKQLGIQSPSRVFREIGKYAIAGLIQGLDSVDESKLKGVTNKIEGFFKKSKIKINVDVNSGDFNPLKNISGAEASEKITSAIEEGFKKSRPKPPSTFSKIFSGIGDTLLAPLKGITIGAFEGVGLQLSKQLGTGLGRGIESQLAPIIGSFDLLGEKLVTSAIPKLGNTVGGKIASAILKSPPLQKLKQDLAGQITSIVGESEQLIASTAGKQQNRQRQQQLQKLSQQELGIELQTAIANAPQRQQQAQKIKQEILPQYQQEVKSKSSQLSSLQADRELLTNVGTETEEIKQAVEEIDLQIAQASSALVEAKKAEQFLQQQIAGLLGETSGAVGKLRMAGADTRKVDETEFALKESSVRANGIVTRLDGNIKIQQENIKEARTRLKAYKQEEARLKAEAIAALQSGDDAGAKNSLLESKKAGLRANSASQEISAYKTNISENLKIKQESAGEFIQERKRLKDSLEQERTALAQRLLDAPQEVQARTTRVKAKPRNVAAKQTTQVEDLVKQPAIAVTPALQIFQDVLAQFQQLAGVKIPANKIPQLVRGPEKAGFTGKYNSVDNAVTLPSSRYDELSKGIISPDVIKTLVHELRHAMQTGFGQRTISQSGNPEFQLIKGTPQEQQQLGSKIQASADFFKKGALGATSGDVEVVKSLEEDAYVFAERYFEQVFKSIQQGLQSGVKSGDVPTEAELLKQVQTAQATITANLKQSFKGPARDRKVTNQELAGSTLTNIDQQIALVSEQLKRTDLSSETRKKLGQFKGTIERQYRTYSPAIRQLQNSQLPTSKAVATDKQGVSGFELFAVEDPEIEKELTRLKSVISRRKKIATGIANPDKEIKRMNQLIKKLESFMPQFDEYQNQLLRELAQKLESQSIGVDDALKQMRSLARIAEKQAQKNLKELQKNAGRSTLRAEAALKQVEQNTNTKVSEIEAGIGFDEALGQRKTRRVLRKIQRGYGGNIDAPTIETEAPRVEKDLPKLPQQSFFKGLGKEFRLARLSALTKQAEYLGQQAQVLLADVDAQIALGKATEKEAQLIQKQIQQNERRLNAVLNQIKRAQSGKDPKLTSGDLQRLSGKAEDLTGRIDADKQRLAGIQLNIKNGKELEPVAKNLRAGIAGGSEASKQQNIKELERQNALIRENLKLLGEDPPARNPFDVILGGADKFRQMLPNVFTLLKGIFAFQVSNFLQGFFTNLATDAFKAFVELDRLKTALNFASGGTAGGAQNLAFVRKTVDDLKVPLKASAEGFTSLAASARNSALEGKGTREIFLGISQASTVLSLSAEDTQGTILALSQMISKGKVSSEELRQQLGERLPGAMGIAARAMGLTEVEFTRLLDTGQILSQDFLPKFAKQLQAEFGDAAKDASGNAQSAIFGVQNAFLSLQQGIGEGVAPAATAGLNGLSVILKGVASVAKELGFILLSVTVTLSVKMVGALQAVIAQLIATKLATGTLSGGMQALGQTINNSFSVKLTAGIFAVLEVINLLNQAVNTELVQSFSKAADAARRAAEESKKAFEKPKPGQENKGTEPVATSGVGRFIDSGIGFLNRDLGPIPGGIFGKKIKTYGQYERDNTANSIEQQGLSNTEALAEGRYRLTEFKTGTGEGGKLRGIDAQLKAAEEQRAILQAQIKRDFVDKGQAVPVESKRQLDSQNLKITALNDQRSDAAKPLTLELNRTTQKINSIKSQLEQLNNPDNIAALGGEAAADKQRQNLKLQLEPLKQFKAEMETALGSLRIDPILAFTQSLRKLNLALAEGQEKNKEKLSGQKLANSTEAIAGFSSNKLAGRKLTFLNANDEYNAAVADEKNYAIQDKAYNESVNRPEFQSTLKRLGVSPDASIAKIDDVLKNTTDEADKGILEKLKSGRESKVKFAEAKQTTVDSFAKLQQTIQDTSLYLLDDSAANSRARIQKDENDKISFLKGAQAVRLISEEMVNEKIARIQLSSSQSQKKNIVDQLTTLRAYHNEGKVSAEEFAKRQRDLSTELTATERQEAENRLAVQQAVQARRLKDIEFANKKAESAIALSSMNATAKNKEKLLASGLTPQAQDQFALSQNQIDQKAAGDRIVLVKNRIAQNKQLYKDGLRDAREFASEQYSLNVELASANRELIDLKITGEEKYRETVEHSIQRIMQAEENRFKKQTSQLDESKTKLDLYNQSLERTNRLEQSRQSLSKALSDAALVPAENQKTDTDDAQSLVDKLKDPNVKRRTKRAIREQLRGMDYQVNSNTKPEEIELQIKEKRIEAEKVIANIKQMALEKEQEFQRKSLENDLKRQKIAAQIALYEAQSAQLSAQKAKNEAEGALKIAISKKDPLAIETAQTNLDIANKQIDLSNQRVDSALSYLNDQPEIAANSTAEQKATQGAQTESLKYGEKRRERQSALDLVEAGEKARRPISLSSAEAKVESTNPQMALPQKIDINQMPKLELKPGESIFDAYQRQREGMKLPTQGAELPSNKADIPPMDKTAANLNSATIQPRESAGGNQFVEALKMANQGIEQRLDALNSAIMTLANTPRSLSISSPNPIDDAADFMNRIGRGQVMAAGV